MWNESLLNKIKEFMRVQEKLTGRTHTMELFSDFSGSIRKTNFENEFVDVMVFDDLSQLENKLNKYKDGIYQELSND